ncbi:thioredoxin family protein [Flagellimonas allohymeniacidonis]|uniref:Thioredoxin family protein n=1 Tax=Flagellimonas allohymeniacidonis TaxID=2517819 RepID=A0A4Q8QET2_9FLAO|nr:thioredoxin family protein [Allomuricauda hymeniacidonis]TAI48147.1 thioredoxin family protein [Allomuricauda hymeniacidonis]
MKPFLIITLLLSFCLGNAQKFNQEIELENGKKFLIGKINLEGLSAEPYNIWFQSGEKAYAIDEALVKKLEEPLSDYHIKLFLGTWCGDSKREVPRLVKILKAANFPMENLDIVALDRRKEHYKKSPTGEERGLNIIKVPTIIFMKQGKETNRIVESPIESLEEDIAQIVFEKPYTPNYASMH